MTVSSSHARSQKLFADFDIYVFASIVAGGFALAYPIYLVMMFRSHDWILAANGRPAVTDFLVFWLAGHSALKGAAAAAYVPQLLHSAETAAAGHAFAGHLPWRYAPLFLFVAAPLALLPYLPAFLVWTAGTLALYALVVSRIAASRAGLLLACAAPAVFINAICGQNGPLTAALIGATLLCLEERPILSGICLGLLSYKPQFGILFPLLLVAGGHWRALVSAAVATMASILVSCVVFGAGTFRAFLHFLPITSNDLLIHGVNGFNKLETVYGLFRWLEFGNSAAWAAQAVAIVATAAALLWLWRQNVPYTLKASAAAAGILLTTPHLFAYDFAVLSVSFAFLYRERAFDVVELAGIALANLCVGAFLFFPTPIGLIAIAIALSLLARRVVSHSTGRGLAASHRPSLP